jgi:multiple sugar transport system ATP-binding protein
MSYLELRGLAKTFPDGPPAVRGIDLSVSEGEFVVLLGPSGCGKTTTLRMVAGLELPTAGRVLMDGRDVTPLRPSERDVGMVFQFYALYPHLSVRENIAFPLRSVGTPRNEVDERVRQVAARTGLEALLDRHPRGLSGGDQQRVSLARAMVRRPKLFLMDEPLGTLDADQRQRLREFIRAQQLDAGVTTLYVTHDQEEAMSLADRIVVMEGGLIRQAAPPSEVYDDPADLFVANFVGSPGMNFVPGEVTPNGFLPSGSPSPIPLSRGLRSGPATLGIRSEFVLPDPRGPIEGTVELDEYLGSCRSLHVKTGFGPMIVRAAAQERRRPGDPIRLSLDPSRVRLFDAGGRRM